MSTMVVRAARSDDLEGIFTLAKQAGTGMTNLPPDLATLTTRVGDSERSFSQDVSEPGTETYLFVLEDQADGTIAGTSGIYARIGIEKPFYSYKIMTVTRTSQELGLTKSSKLLHLVNDYAGTSEIGMLFLSAAYRGGGNGRLLGVARFLMMAEFPERFADMVIAEMRGVIFKDGRSPFWDSLGRHFFDMPFPKADSISAVTDNQFIADLMPEYPIYQELLTPEAQAVIGVPHDNTKPAYRMLLKEGFRFENYIDIFDGGPALQVRLENIRSARDSRKAVIREVISTPPTNKPAGEETSKPGYFVANCRLPDFRVCQTTLKLNDDDSVDLPDQAARVLEIEPGDPVRFIEI